MDTLLRTYDTTLWTKITMNNELYRKIVMNFTLCFGCESCTLVIRNYLLLLLPPLRTDIIISQVGNMSPTGITPKSFNFGLQ